MKIGILITGHAIPEFEQDFGGDYDAVFAHMLRDQGFDFQGFNVVDGEFPDGPDAADGWLITGSKHGAYEDHDWIPPLEQLIREIYAEGRPLVGVCFGHQVIAQALGGKVEKFRGGWSVGHTTYDIEGEQMAINAWHQDQVTELPPGAQVIGSSDFCANAALVYDDRIYTIQPHPEFTSHMIGQLLDTRAKDVVPEPIINDAKTKLDAPIDSDKIASRIVEFFKQGA